MINRVVLLVRYRQPFIDWINAVDDSGMVVTLTDANEDNQVYLLDEEDADALEEWLALNHELLFEGELEAWCTDEDLWPEDRGREVFDAWFRVETHSVVYDVGSGPIFDDEAGEEDDDEDDELDYDSDDD